MFLTIFERMCCVMLSVMSDSLRPPWSDPPGASVHGIFQARILEWVAISYSMGSSQLRDLTRLLASPALSGRFFTTAHHSGKPLSSYTTQNISSLSLSALY